MQFFRLPPRPSEPVVRVVCISDTHCQTRDDIPRGHVLVHAGDLTNAGTVTEIQEQVDWLKSIPGFMYKVVIAGNHDTFLDPRSRQQLAKSDQHGEIDWGEITYLANESRTLRFFGLNSRDAGPLEAVQDRGREVRRLVVTGCPSIPRCGGPEHAFQYERGLEGEQIWKDTIRIDTDILVTHTPPQWHLDLPRGMGCSSLLQELWRVKPKLHVFGHVHEGSGKSNVWWSPAQEAYESLCRNEAEKGWGFFRGILSLANWLDIAIIVVGGLANLIWNRKGRDRHRGSILINAALKNHKSGGIDNPVQVVDI
ncbi:MAG: hypothetical protein M1831_007245 [Alyxoria varia]|nr:MAG: hypothetical protein M1831_007245 [Alyxoria varia]